MAGVNYIMGVPGADDVMLNYQSTSFHDALYLRRVLGLRPAPEFEEAAGRRQLPPFGTGNQPSGEAADGMREMLHPATGARSARMRALTPARVALGRTGVSLQTRDMLEFQRAHAEARNAVHVPLNGAIKAGIMPTKNRPRQP